MTEIEQGSFKHYQDLGVDDAAKMQVKAALATKMVTSSNDAPDTDPKLRPSWV